MLRLPLVLAATAIYAGSEAVSISGIVYDMSLHPLHGVVVSLESDSSLKSIADKDGNWSIDNAPSHVASNAVERGIRIEGTEIVYPSRVAGILRVDELGFEGRILSSTSVAAAVGETRIRWPRTLGGDRIVRLRFDGRTVFFGRLLSMPGAKSSKSAARAQSDQVDNLLYTYNGILRAKSPLKTWTTRDIVQKLDTTSVKCVGDLLFGPKSSIAMNYEAANGSYWSRIDLGMVINPDLATTCDSILSPMKLTLITTSLRPDSGIKSAMMDTDVTAYYRDSVRSRGSRGIPGLTPALQFRHYPDSDPKTTITCQSIVMDVRPEGYLGRNGIYLTVDVNKLSGIVLNGTTVNLDTLKALVNKANGK